MAETWLVFDALGDEDAMVGAVRRAVALEAAASGARLRTVAVPHAGMPTCKGCFSCWTKTPGQCRVANDGLGLAEAVAGSTAVVLLSPVVLGGYAPGLRQAMERAVLPNLLPFFSKVAGRSRHGYRYPSPPALYGVGVTAGRDPESAALYGNLVARNAANMRAPRYGAGVVCREDGVGAAQAAVGAVFARGAEGIGKADAAPSIVALVGSPRPRGASAAFAAHAARRLTEGGAVVRTFSLRDACRDAEAFAALAEAVDAADGVYLAFPVYADAVPGAAVEVLER